MYKFYWNIYFDYKPQQQGFYWNIDFDTSVCFKILAPNYIILAKIVGKRCMFQDSSKKKVGIKCIFQDQMLWICDDLKQCNCGSPSIAVTINLEKRELTAQLDPKKTLFQKTHEGTL